MKKNDPRDLSGLSLAELFQAEVETQAAIITDGLLELEQNPASAPRLEALMRAAHSLKGAARIVNCDPAVAVAHAIEDCFVAAQEGKIELGRHETDVLFEGMDLLMDISRVPEGSNGDAALETRTRKLLPILGKLTTEKNDLSDTRETSLPHSAEHEGTEVAVSSGRESSDRTLRLTARNLNRLLGLAGESVVEARWLQPFAASLLRLKRMQSDLQKSIDGLRDSLEPGHLKGRIGEQITETIYKAAECERLLSGRLADLEMYDRRSASLAHRLYREVLQCRMRPFGDGARLFPRMVRDLARVLGKEVRLEIVGEHTPVDRDILERLEAPLAHLLRNAVDHGCESPQERERAGKPPVGVIRLEARHTAGLLVITVADDGAGVEPGKLRENVARKQLTSSGAVEKLSDTELLEFLLLPGFTLKETVTEISGRGVGLDVVQNMVKSVRGSVRMASRPGAGMRFQLHLPLTLSVVRALIVEIAGEPYAIPLSQISSTLKLERERISLLEGRPHFAVGEQQIGLLTAHQVLERGEPAPPGDSLAVVVLGEKANRHGIIVDRFLGERELVIQALDTRLGKVKNISAGALMEDGSPVLIIDVEELLASIAKLLSEGRPKLMPERKESRSVPPVKRILIVEDSLTVRELERKLLTNHGYQTEVAVDGLDGWTAAQNGNYDLVITDVDMPRMDGIELATRLKRDGRLKSVPIMIISYKDREQDRLRGLEAGADYYLAKGMFHDDNLLRAVADLIGEPGS